MSRFIIISCILLFAIHPASAQQPGDTKSICREGVPGGWLCSEVGSLCAGGSAFSISDYSRKITYFQGLPAGSKLKLSADVKPQGWVKINQTVGPAIPAIIDGKLGTTIYYNNDIVKVDGMPNGSQVEMFIDVPPAGWVRTSIRLNPDAVDNSQHYETITNIADEPANRVIETINNLTPLGYVTLDVGEKQIGRFTFITRKIMKVEGLAGYNEYTLVDTPVPDGWIVNEYNTFKDAGSRRFPVSKILRISALDPAKAYKNFGTIPEGWVQSDYLVENTPTGIYIAKMMRNYASPLSGDEMGIIDTYAPRGWMATHMGGKFIVDRIYTTYEILRSSSLNPDKKYPMAQVTPPPGWLVTGLNVEQVATTFYQTFEIENYYNKPVGSTMTIIDNFNLGVLPPQGWTLISTGTIQGLGSGYKTYTIRKQATVVTGYASGTWTKAGNPYILNGRVIIERNSKLNILQGVEVQTYTNTDELWVEGNLQVKGIAGDSVSFSGLRRTGEVNTTPGGFLTFQPDCISNINYAIFNKLGDNYSDQRALLINSNEVSITNSSFRNNLFTAVRISPGIKPILNHNAFSDNRRAIESNIAGLEKVTENTNANIKLENAAASGEQLTLKKPGPGSYYFFPVQAQINEGTILTIEPGTEIKWSGDNKLYADLLSVYGTLIAKGTDADSIRFTGHTRWKTDLSVASPGYIAFMESSKNNVLDRVVFDGMGTATLNGITGIGGMLINTSSFSLKNSAIKNSAAQGITIRGVYTPEISLNRFTNNQTAIQSSLNSARGIKENYGAKILLVDEPLNADLVLVQPGEASHYQINDMLNIAPGRKVEISPGTTIDFGVFRGEFNVSGTLLAKGTKLKPIHFIGPKLLAGINNGATLKIDRESKSSVLDFINMTNMGNENGRKGAIELFTSDVTMSNLDISDGYYAGVICYDGGATITSSKIWNNKIGVQSWTASPTLKECQISGNSLFGIQVLSNYDVKVDARECSWGDPSGPYHLTLNPAGKANQVTDKVLFKPFKTDNRKAQQVTVAALRTLTYGEADVVLNAQSSSLLPVITTSANAAVIAVLPDQKLRITGAGKTTLSFIQPGDSAYAPDTLSIEVTVSPAKLILTADNKSKQYGEGNPLFTFSGKGMVNGDDLPALFPSLHLATDATVFSKPGDYNILFQGAINANYDITTIQGILTVMQAPAPVITSVSSLTAIEGMEITITGKYFLDATTVSFGGVAAAAFTVNSSETLTARVGKGESGALTITTPSGTYSFPGFKFVPVPKILASGALTIQSGGQVILRSELRTGFSFQWFKDNVIIPNAISADYSAKEKGAYTLEISSGGLKQVSQPLSVEVIFSLYADNFLVTNTAASCKNAANGLISISSKVQQNFFAIVNGPGIVEKRFTFTNELSIGSLVAGTYNVCIGITDKADYKQCFTSVIGEPKDLSVYTSVLPGSNTLSLSMQGGLTYQVNLNGKIYTTSASQLSLQLNAGLNSLQISTDKACQGMVTREILYSPNQKPYPNPFSTVLNINLGMEKSISSIVTIHDMAGRQVFYKIYNNAYGLNELDLAHLITGVYILRTKSDNNVQSFRIIKN